MGLLSLQTNPNCVGGGGGGEDQTAPWSQLTLGNRAAISVTARRIFSEQGRKLWDRGKGRSDGWGMVKNMHATPEKHHPDLQALLKQR